MDWLSALRHHIKKSGEFWVDQTFDRYRLFDDDERNSIMRKKELFKNRQAQVVKSRIQGQITGMQQFQNRRDVSYIRHLQLLIKQKNHFYIEEHLSERKAEFSSEELVIDKGMNHKKPLDVPPKTLDEMKLENNLDNRSKKKKGKGLVFNRLQAVRYAERWWGSHNPEYKLFENDCSNFISQCLRAGGAPMHGQFNKHQGWWYAHNQWSLSWAVAHALRWYLSSPENLIGAVAVENPEQLMPGDIICYDFEGDGRYDHSTIVTQKDAEGMPLVNAHTTDSRHRYWSYEDSTAWTENIQYKFFHIMDS